MDKNLFSELDDIRMELERGIGMITVIADGLNGYTRCGALTGLRAEAYVKAVVMLLCMLLHYRCFSHFFPTFNSNSMNISLLPIVI